jgi:hypothetical protein
MGQVLVRPLLPAGRPDQLIAVSQLKQTFSTAVSDAVGKPIHRIHPPRGRTVVREAEHADHPVDVHKKNGLIRKL